MKFIDIVNICRKDLTKKERKTLAKVLLGEVELLFVSDGAVTPDCMVWWKNEDGTRIVTGKHYVYRDWETLRLS